MGYLAIILLFTHKESTLMWLDAMQHNIIFHATTNMVTWNVTNTNK